MLENMKVKIVNRSDNALPEYSTSHSAGMDIKAFLSDSITIRSGEITLIPTGLYIELPDGYEAQIRPRSGLALKHGITILNAPGTIDADYRGEIGIILINHSPSDFVINNGDRICQMIVTEYTKVEWLSANELNESKRGDGGFGHTGI